MTFSIRTQLLAGFCSGLLLLPVISFAQSSYPCQLIVEHRGGNTYELDRVNGPSYCDSVLDDFGYDIGERFELDPAIAAAYGITGSYTVVYNNIDAEGVIEFDDALLIPSVLDAFEDEADAEENNDVESDTDTETDDTDSNDVADEEDAEIRALQLQVIALLQQLVNILSERMGVTDEPVNEVVVSATDSEIVVFDQVAGTSVTITSVIFPFEQGWLVIRKPDGGPIRGASYFDVAQNIVPTTIPLLVVSEPSETYAAVFFTDNDDRAFNIADDVQLSGVETVFEIQATLN